MANWELIDVDYDTCKLCEDYTVCNIYITESTCNCLKCISMGNRIIKAVCGACMGKWLKSRDMDNAE